MKRLIAVFGMLAMLMVLAPAPAGAAFVGTVETFTVSSGESVETVTITMAQANIKEMYLWVPALDADDTATASLTITPFANSTATSTSILTGTVVPNGWTSKVIGATDDNAIVKVFSSSANIYVDGVINLTMTCSSAQIKDRVFYVAIIREY